ncbi:hypothetical protein AJ79_09878 [Helicocarpus griseus UAMH5409]|uniref:AtmA protein n=1 Tax=Helicocarpus griseus UAMH5409 TaxID=1447875 RepID=A0A2B7WGP7_9EURO|nr:hypothetical protein AJ79_09878 [Helicocarpus griseus UAMH5409]
MALTTLVRTLLPLTSLFGVYSIFVFSRQNGFLDRVDQAVAAGKLPGTDEPLRTDLTGVAALDQLLATLITFFWTTIDGSAPATMLHGLNFAGALGGLWPIVLLEAARPGNKGFVVYPAIFGILTQLFTFGVMAPIYAAIHLATSRTLSAPSRATITPSPSSLTGVKLIPLALLAGYLLPTLSLILPATTSGPLRSTQERIAFWQPWPLFLWILHATSTQLANLFCSSSNPSNKATATKQTLSTLRPIYALSFALIAIPHIVSYTLSITPLLAPALFDSSAAASLHPATVFLNTLPWSGARTESLGQGALWFLQWDHLLGSGALLMWAVVLHVATHRSRGVKVGCLAFGVKVLALCAVSGVAGAAVELMWERDEVVLAREEGEGEKKRR